MSTINYTYNVIVDRFRQFAAGHFQLRRFTHGEISQADLEKEAEWPWLHVKPRAINYSPGTRSFSFEIFISDLPRDKEDKTGYQAESITDCSLIFQDLINEIYLGNMFGSDVVLTRPVNSEPFVEQYTHTLTGVTGTIELNLDYDWSACSIPASWNYNTPTDSGTDGWGALQFIESLDQNGVFVSLLNDVEAPGNSYYYGTNASGVKGWYAIVDNVGLTCETLPDCATIISIVDDIAALESGKVDKVAGKGLSTEDYTTAEKSKLAGIQAGAEVNVNADWNAVSGDAQILNKPTIPSIAGLVPETRTLTINGTTQDLSADRTFTIATGLTVGTTPITSGTVGRVLFEGTGNVIQESANLFWNNTNNRLGIGTSSPASALHVNGEIRLNAGQSLFLDVSNNIYVLGAGNQFRIYSGGISALNIATNGNVLIGTTTDAGFKLDVNGTARVSGALSADVGIFSGGTVTFSNTGTTSRTGFSFATYSNSISSGALTGYNTTFSFTPFSGNATYTGFHFATTINQTGTANGITRGLYINPTLTSAADFRAIETTAGNVLFGASGTGFYWDNTNSRLGIGTATPAYGIDINGTFRVNNTGVSTAYSWSVQRLQFNNGNAAANIGYIRGVSDGVIRLLTAAEDTFTRLQFGGGTTAFPALQRSGAALCVVDGTGTGVANLLIGTTTDAGYKLDVNGTARVKGTGTTSATSAFTVQNSAGTESFRVRDNGSILIASGILSLDAMQGYTGGHVRINRAIASQSTSTMNASAEFEVESTTQGFLPPRMTTTQKNAIATPAAGLVVYDTTLNKLCVYTTAWETITSV